MKPELSTRAAAAACASLLLATVPLAQTDGPSPLERDVPASGELPEPFGPVDPVELGILAPEGAAEPVLRESLDPVGEAELAFAKVPGGIVFGRSAVPQGPRLDWSSVRVSFVDGRASLEVGGEHLALPAVDAGFLRAALAFALRERGDWLVDIREGGEVLLAAELLDTPAGLAAVRADLVPQFYVPIAVGAKTVIVDREVRLVVAPARAVAYTEADLEVRFYRPGFRPGDEAGAERVGTVELACRSDAAGSATLRAPEGQGLALMADRLSEAARLAGWIGLLRFVADENADGLAELRTALAASAGERTQRTPRRIASEDRAAWILGTGAAAPAEIPEWMREHRRRVEESRLPAKEGRPR